MSATYQRRIGRHERILTARPFTLCQAKELSEIAKELKDLPASQRRILAEAMDKGVRASLNLALYQTANQKEKGKRLLEAYCKLGELLDCDGKGESMFFWRRKNGVWQTALLEALELLELSAIN